jgi:hypothetical protein
MQVVCIGNRQEAIQKEVLPHCPQVLKYQHACHTQQCQSLTNEVQEVINPLTLLSHKV